MIKDSCLSEVKKKFFVEERGLQSSPMLTGRVIFALLSSSFSHFSFISSLRPSICLSVSLLGQTASSLICQSFFPIYSGQSLPIRALSDIMPEPIKRGAWWRRIDALFLSRKSSVSGTIPSFSLTDDARHEPYPFSLQVSIMAVILSKFLFFVTFIPILWYT